MLPHTTPQSVPTHSPFIKTNRPPQRIPTGGSQQTHPQIPHPPNVPQPQTHPQGPQSPQTGTGPQPPQTGTPTQPPKGQIHQLLACGPLTDKTYALAHFIVDPPLELSNWQQPIHIARPGSEGKSSRPPPDPSQPTALKQEARKSIQKSRRGHAFRIADTAEKNVFNGYLELDQSNRFDSNSANKYVIFKNEGGVFKVIPCDDWYTFKREPREPKIPLEEAERMMKEQLKGEKANAEPPKQVSILNIMKIKEDKDKEKKQVKEKFNATGELVELDDEDLKGLVPGRRKKKDKGEDIDFDNDFDDDNKEDKLTNNSFDVGKLSSGSKEVKKLMKTEKGTEVDEFSDDEEKEFFGVEDLLDKKPKETKSGEKRPNESQGSSNSKKARTEGANGGGTAGATGVISEKEFEKQVREFLTLQPKVSLSKLITKFRSTISSIGKPAFKQLLKRIAEAKKEDGQTFIVLKDDQYKTFRL